MARVVVIAISSCTLVMGSVVAAVIEAAVSMAVLIAAVSGRY